MIYFKNNMLAGGVKEVLSRDKFKNREHEDRVDFRICQDVSIIFTTVVVNQ